MEELECKLCGGSGKATFVDMAKVPVGTSMVMGDETWKLYEEISDCPDCTELKIEQDGIKRN